MLALNNGGIYRTLSADDSDISALLDSTDELFPDASKELERDFDSGMIRVTGWLFCCYLCLWPAFAKVM